MSYQESLETVKKLLTDYIVGHQDSFYRLAFSYCKNQEAALDIIQEAILKAFSHLSSLKDPDLIRPWFYRILVNESLTYLRKNKRLIPMLEENMIPDNPGHTDLSTSLTLYQEIDRLDEKLKTIIILRFFEDMKLEDIAAVTNCNLNTVKSRLYRALKLLKQSIEEE